MEAIGEHYAIVKVFLTDEQFNDFEDRTLRSQIVEQVESGEYEVLGAK